MLRSRKQPKIKPGFSKNGIWQHPVVGSPIILYDNGFNVGKFDFNKTLSEYRCDNRIHKRSIIVNGDYIYLKEEDGTRVDLVTIWNRDIAGTISDSSFNFLVHILKKGSPYVEK